MTRWSRPFRRFLRVAMAILAALGRPTFTPDPPDRPIAVLHVQEAPDEDRV